MRVEINGNEYKQVNTNPDKYMTQNLSSIPLNIIIGDTQKPANDAAPDFVFNPIIHGASSNDPVTGIVWAKSTSLTIEGIMGLVEG